MAVATRAKTLYRRLRDLMTPGAKRSAGRLTRRRMLCEPLETRDMLAPLAFNPTTGFASSGEYVRSAATAMQRVGDFDGNGISDIVGIDSDGTIWVDLRNSDSFQTRVWAETASLDKWGNFIVGDFNGDGLSDVAGLQQSGYWAVGLSTGSAFQFDLWDRWADPSQWKTISVGDLNGDQKADVAAMRLDGTWWVGQSDGHSFHTALWDQWADGSQWKSVFVGDFNGDKKDDVAGLRLDGAWWVGLAKADSFVTARWDQWAAAPQWSSLFVGDFNGDRKADVLGMRFDGTWWTGLSRGNSFSVARWGQWAVFSNWQGLFVADFNGDGRDDIAGLRKDNTWWVGQAAGPSFRTALWGSWTPGATWTSLQVGNFDNNPQADVAGFGADRFWNVGFSVNQAFASTLLQHHHGGEALPTAPGNPWLSSFARWFVDAEPKDLLTRMFFNNSQSLGMYLNNFKGVLRGWVIEANRQGLSTIDQLSAFLRTKLNDHFLVCRNAIRSACPNLTDQQYRSMMVMNLVNAYFDYGAQPGVGNLAQLLPLDIGECSEIAALTTALIRIQGITANRVSVVLDYTTRDKPFFAGHQVCYAAGMWIDSEVNVAFKVDLKVLQSIQPSVRLRYLLNIQQVFGFYNWYLKPEVRLAQTNRGVDGGVLVAYYDGYFAGLGQGDSHLDIIP